MKSRDYINIISDNDILSLSLEKYSDKHGVINVKKNDIAPVFTKKSIKDGIRPECHIVLSSPSINKSIGIVVPDDTMSPEYRKGTVVIFECNASIMSSYPKKRRICVLVELEYGEYIIRYLDENFLISTNPEKEENRVTLLKENDRIIGIFREARYDLEM